MTESRRHPSQTLMYARPAPPAPARVSGLAIGSLPVAILASPCILSQVHGVNRFPALYVIAGALAVALPIVALIRIGRSRGTRTGKGWAIAGLLISVLLWGGLLLVVLGLGSDPHWHG